MRFPSRGTLYIWNNRDKYARRKKNLELQDRVHDKGALRIKMLQAGPNRTKMRFVRMTSAGRSRRPGACPGNPAQH